MNPITVVKRGEIVQHHGDPTWVLRACDAVQCAYWCDSHQEAFPTKEHFRQHAIDVDGEHRVARSCHKHGIETIPQPESA